MSSASLKSSVLKEARESKGMTLEMVHESTKIPLDALRAIEEGYSIRILTPFYYKGFVKNYADFLGLDVDKVFQEYNLERATKPQINPSARPVRQFSNAREKTADVLADFFTPRRKKLIVKAVAVIFCLFIVVKLFGWVGSKMKAAPSKARAQKIQPKPPVKPLVKKQEEKKVSIKPEVKKKELPPVAAKIRENLDEAVAVEAHPEKTFSIKETTSIASKVRLTVKAKRDSWLRVKSDGQVVFQSTLRKGSSESWGASEEIELSGKNINLLDFEVNGKLLGQLGSSDRKAKKVIITKDGLSVKK